MDDARFASQISLVPIGALTTASLTNSWARSSSSSGGWAGRASGATIDVAPLVSAGDDLEMGLEAALSDGEQSLKELSGGARGPPPTARRVREAPGSSPPALRPPPAPNPVSCSSLQGGRAGPELNQRLEVETSVFILPVTTGGGTG